MKIPPMLCLPFLWIPDRRHALAWLLVPWLFLSGFKPVPSASAVSDPPVENPRVLILHSYHAGFTWADHVTRGIRTEFHKHVPGVELLFEYMDVKRRSDAPYFEALHRFFKKKYDGQKIDVVIVSDDHALEFLLGQGKDLFPGVPAVFCGVNGYDPRRHRGNGRGLTGVVESVDIQATLDLALDLHPGTETVVYVTDTSLTGKAFKKTAETVFEGYQNRLQFTYLEHRTMDALQDAVSRLEKGTLVFAFIFNRDTLGRIWSHEYNLSRMAAHCPVPIYSVWEFYLGHGIVGGRLTSGKAHGTAAAGMALDILKGRNAVDIPVKLKSPNRFMFDDEQMKRFGISKADLPPGSIVINEPISIFEAHKGVVWSLFGFILGLLLVLGFLIRDTRLRRGTEAALRKSEGRIRELVETMADGIAVYEAVGEGRDFVIKSINSAGERIAGVQRENAVGRCVTEVFPGIQESAFGLFPVFQRVWKTGRRQYLPPALYEDAHRRVWVENDVFRLASGEVLAVFRDVTARIQSEKDVKESEARYRSLVMNSMNAVAIYQAVDDGDDFIFLEFNKAAEKIEKTPKENIIGKRVTDVFPGVKDFGVFEVFQRVWKTGNPEHFPVTFYRDDRITGWRENFVYRLPSGEIVAVYSDETERMQALEALKRLNLELEERVARRTADLETKTREMEAFTYSVSHDLKAPLRGIDGYARLLMEGHAENLDEEGRRFLDTICTATERMNRLIEDLLAYSRMERRTLNIQHLEIEPFVRMLLLEHEADMENQQVQISVPIPFEAVMTDPESLAQILGNFLGNALKFTRDTGASAIEIGGEETETAYRFWVKDTGIGFDMKYQHKVFEIFQRLHREEDYPGTGVGLAIVKKAAERLQGRVWAQSAPGKGATFFLELPKTPSVKKPENDIQQKERRLNDG